MRKFFIKRPLAMLLCIVMVLSMIPVLPIAAMADNEFKVYSDSNAVSSVAVPRNGAVTLTAKNSDAAAFQWQIQAAPGLWVNIQGENEATINLRYAMVANLMTNGAAAIRCVSGDRITDEITVTLDPAAPEFDTPAPSNQIIVQKEATVVEAPAVDMAALEEEYNAASEAADAAQVRYDAVLAEKNAAQKAYDEAAAAEAAAKAAYDAAVAPAETTAAMEAATETTAAAPAVNAEELKAAWEQASANTSAAKAVLNEKAAALAAEEAAYTAAMDALDAAEAKVTAAMSQQGYGVMAAAEADVPTTYTVVINYVFADGEQAASPYTATVAAGSALNVTVNSPSVLGYAPDKATVTINEDSVTNNITETVTYQPAEVNFTVKHYQQNLNDDHYTLVETETKPGYTESPVGKDLGKTYSGFYSLLYDETVEIAADGSTEVEIYYDRYYYLMNFDLDGGYGVEPIYARYGAPIEWKTPVKQGYTFAGWTPDPQGVTTMPAENRTYKASWTLHNTVPVTVIFWGENPNDEGYSYDHSGSVQAEPGKDFTFSDSLQFIICGQESHTHTDDCTYACGKTEHTHTAEECGWACNQTEHSHSASCYTLTCTESTEHTHTTACYANVGEATSHSLAPDNPVNGQIYKWSFIFATGESIYINGTWYKYTGGRDNVENGQIMPAICGKTEHKHTDYTGSCYTRTCGQDAHTHQNSCGYACGQEAHTHSAASCGMSCGKTEHTHINSCYQTGAGMDSDKWTFVSSETVTVAADGSSVVNVYYDRVEYMVQFYLNKTDNEITDIRITAKWGASIYDKWPTYDGSSSWYTSKYYNDSSEWQVGIQTMPVGGAKRYGPKSGSSSYTAYYYVEIVPGEQETDETGNFVTYQGMTFKLHHSDTSASSGSVSASDRYAIEGFEYKGEQTSDGSFTNAKFYYTRNSYNLEYMSSGSKLEDKTASVKYEAPLSPYSITPPYPSNLEPNAYVFEGWYTDQYFHNKVDWTNDTMPASDVMVYAHWVPKTHTVTFALDKDAEPGSLVGYPNQTVPHGSKITPVEEPKNGSYDFIGWFYEDENGVEKAFDPENMPVNRDLNLYGKWSASTMVPYTIKYAVENGDGTLTYIADDTTGNALALTTKTFEAKTGDELKEGYQSGYFPKEASHSITMSADEGAKNEFTFIYVPKEKVPYTVRYLEEGTNTVLHDPKTVETRDAIVTETFEPVPGYMPDAYQKRLVLSADDEQNVIIFWYVKDSTHAPLHIVHYTQNIEGDGYTVYQESTDINALIGKTYSEDPLTIPGFTHNPNAEGTVMSGKMTAEGLELRLYYDRTLYPYEFRFLEQGTNKVLAAPVTGTARYQAHVSHIAENIPGYTIVSQNPQAILIAMEDPAVSMNVRTFYYQEKQVTIDYKVVGPDGNIDATGNIGTVTPASETIKVRTDVAGGSTAAAKDNTYKFVGWYKDEGCTQSVGTDAHYTPVKTGDVVDGVAQTYEAATYYAKFDHNLSSMKVTKIVEAGATYDRDDVFVFDISSVDGKFTISLKAGETVTINNVVVGQEYTVTERTENSRYDITSANGQKLTPKPRDEEIATVIFKNKLERDEWLGETSTDLNVFKSN